MNVYRVKSFKTNKWFGRRTVKCFIRNISRYKYEQHRWRNTCTSDYLPPRFKKAEELNGFELPFVSNKKWLRAPIRIPINVVIAGVRVFICSFWCRIWHVTYDRVKNFNFYRAKDTREKRCIDFNRHSVVLQCRLFVDRHDLEDLIGSTVLCESDHEGPRFGASFRHVQYLVDLASDRTIVLEVPQLVGSAVWLECGHVASLLVHIQNQSETNILEIWILWCFRVFLNKIK